MSDVAARAQALGVAPGTAAGYVSALQALERFAVVRGKSLVLASAVLLAEYAGESDATFAMLKRTAAAWRWLRVSAGMEPPSKEVLHQVVRHAATRAKRAGKISSKVALDVAKVLRTVRLACVEARRVFDDARSSWSNKFVAARNVCALLAACFGFCRSGDLCQIWAESVAATDEAVSFRCALSKEVLLARGTGSMSDIVILGAVPEDPLLCPVVWFRLFQEQRILLEATKVAKFLLCGVKGERLKPSTLGRPLQSVLRLAKVSGSPHCFRGSFASAALDLGFEVGAVTRQGRWKSVSTFWKFYDRRGMVSVVMDAVEASRAKSCISAFPRLLWQVVSR